MPGISSARSALPWPAGSRLARWPPSFTRIRRMLKPFVPAVTRITAPASHPARRALLGWWLAPTSMIPFSVLDLSPITAGGDAADALRNTLDLAHHAERWGYHALLARRAPQHARHRQRRDRRGDRPRRRRHVDDPRRRRRHHAAEPRAARHRRTVRHARVALSRPHRPRPRPRARHRHADRARAAPRPRAAADAFPAGRASSCRRTSRRAAAGAAVPRGPGRRARTCRSGCSGRACSARSSPRSSACRSRSRRTSRPII